MLNFKNIIILIILLTQNNFNTLNETKHWATTCTTSTCSLALNTCMNCYGEAQCRHCIKMYNSDCELCANDIFNKTNLHSIYGTQYMLCLSNDLSQSKVCHIFCRGSYKVSGMCSHTENLNVCQCTNTQQ